MQSASPVIPQCGPGGMGAQQKATVPHRQGRKGGNENERTGTHQQLSQFNRDDQIGPIGISATKKEAREKKFAKTGINPGNCKISSGPTR